MSAVDKLVAQMHREFRTFRLIPKERSVLMRALYYGLLMWLWCPQFMTTYTTVIITWVYMPEDLINTERAYGVLRHERVHMRDCMRTGIVPFVVSYLFLLPAGLTCRSIWEMRGYEETMRVEHEKTGNVSDATLEHIKKRFVSSEYLWMCPFPKLVDRWLRRARAKVMGANR